MPEFLEPIMVQLSLALMEGIKLLVLILIGVAINWLRKKTDLEVAQLVLSKVEESGKAHVRHWFEEVSKVHIKAAEDNKITAAEKKQLLEAAGKASRAEWEHLNEDLFKELKKVMPNASDYIEKKFNQFYEELKSSFHVG